MFNVGDYVVYRKDVCRIVSYREKYMKDTDYYILTPVYDETLKIDVPINSKYLKNVLSSDEVEVIIDNIPNIDVIDIPDKMLENEYKRLLNEDGYEGLIKIIKTTYLRNTNRINNKRKISEKDDEYFRLAEKYLYNEFAVSLNMSYDEVKKYIFDRIEALQN